MCTHSSSARVDYSRMLLNFLSWLSTLCTTDAKLSYVLYSNQASYLWVNAAGTARTVWYSVHPLNMLANRHFYDITCLIPGRSFWLHRLFGFHTHMDWQLGHTEVAPALHCMSPHSTKVGQMEKKWWVLRILLQVLWAKEFYVKICHIGGQKMFVIIPLLLTQLH